MKLLRRNKKWLLLGILSLLILIFVINKAKGAADFKVFLEAAQLIWKGENPYNNWIFVNEGSYCLYFYSPLWAAILIPFSFLPSFIPNFLWLLLNLYFLYRIWVLLKNYISPIRINQKGLNLILIFTLLSSIRFIEYNFSMIQMTIFILWGCLESMRLIKKDKFIIGGALLALIINIKILPIVILPYLFYRGYFKGFISTLVFSVLCLVIPAFIMGWETNNFLLKEWWSVINPLNPEHSLETELGTHSLTSLIPNLLHSTTGELSYGRNLFELGTEKALTITNIFRLALITSTLGILGISVFKKSLSKLHELRELSYLLLLIPLIFPHQQKYAFALCIPAMFYIVRFLVENRLNRKKSNNRWVLVLVLFSFSFILMTLSTDGVIGRELNNITQHYKTITWGTLLLIPILFMISPKVKN